MTQVAISNAPISMDKCRSCSWGSPVDESCMLHAPSRLGSIVADVGPGMAGLALQRSPQRVNVDAPCRFLDVVGCAARQFRRRSDLVPGRGWGLNPQEDSGQAGEFLHRL